MFSMSMPQPSYPQDPSLQYSQLNQDIERSIQMNDALQPENNRNSLIQEIFRSTLSDAIPKISIGTGLICMIVGQSIVKYPKCYDSDNTCYYGNDNKQMYLDITGTILITVGMCLISFVPVMY